MHRSSVLCAVCVAALAVMTGPVPGAPITYQGMLEDSVTQTDSVSSSGVHDDPDTARYWNFFAEQGDSITIEVQRLEEDLDPALWVYEGVYSDTSAFGGEFNSSDSGFVDFADDEIPDPGPFGDPRSQFTATLSGIGEYTAAVTNYSSDPDDGGDGRFNYEITATNTTVIPLPSSAALGAFGLAGLALRRTSRRRGVR